MKTIFNSLTSGLQDLRALRKDFNPTIIICCMCITCCCC